jgi:hypothetical protein
VFSEAVRETIVLVWPLYDYRRLYYRPEYFVTMRDIYTRGIIMGGFTIRRRSRDGMASLF